MFGETEFTAARDQGCGVTVTVGFRSRPSAIGHLGLLLLAAIDHGHAHGVSVRLLASHGRQRTRMAATSIEDRTAMDVVIDGWEARMRKKPCWRRKRIFRRQESSPVLREVTTEMTAAVEAVMGSPDPGKIDP
ncbi:hypothetical protein ACLOJK_005516 [Asimina triloba]